MQTQRRRQIRSEGLIDFLGHLHAGISAGDTRRLEYGAAIAPCGHRLAVAERFSEQHDEFDVGGRRGAAGRSTVTVRRPAFRTRPTGAITNAVTPSAAVAFTSLETPAKSDPTSAMIPILPPSIGPGSANICTSEGELVTVLGGFAFRGRQTETGGNLLAQVGVDVGLYLEFRFLDRLLVDLAQLEAESFDDVGLFVRA